MDETGNAESHPILDIQIGLGDKSMPTLKLKREPGAFGEVNVDKGRVFGPGDVEISDRGEDQETLTDDSGEDFGEGEDENEGDSMRFVSKEELDAVKKDIEEVHVANEALRSLITDT